MWFIVSKTILYLIVPPASLFIIMAAGLVIMKYCRTFGRFLTAAGFISLYLLSIGPVSDMLVKPLETFAPPFKDKQVKADAIVVLGGGVMELSWAGQPAVASDEAQARLIKGIVLYRKLHMPLVLVGGNGDPARNVTADADAMKQTALALGVPSRDIIVENKSRNTLEGARALNQVIKGKRILLVTSAYHLKRATGMFKKKGFQVIPVPAVYLSEQRKLSLYSLIPRARALSVSSAACSEYITLLWYKTLGEI